MKPVSPKSQNGFALLILVVMLMTLGGFVLVKHGQGLLKDVEAKKFEHNTRVLKEAKQALLQFGYNYPVSNNKGPGRLPCPDLDNDGIPETPFNCSSTVGRLPWSQQNLNLYDIRDADGERLWYAVSDNFSTQDAANLNSDTFGTITLIDQAGNLIFAGDDVIPKGGIAAVIIAPASEMAGQDRIAGPDDPANYLDSFNGFDNSVLTNGESDTNDDGFILGPVFDPAQNINVINDQIIVITAAEVIEAAEKATLQAYRTAINNYRQNIWGGAIASYRYPWLDPYSSNDGLVTFDAGIPAPLPVSDPIVGRLPSIFGNYFGGSISGSIKSEIELSILYDGVVWNDTTAIADVNFDGGGNLMTNSSHSPGVQTFYLWDGHATTPHVLSPQDGVWELCTGTAGTGGGGTGDAEDDCNRKTDGTFKIPTDSDPEDSDVWLEVKVITIDFNQPATPLTFNNADLKASPLNHIPPTAATHAYVSADYNNDSGHLLLTNDIDHDFKGGFSVQSVGPAFSATDRIRVGIRYYPELSAWAQVNQWHDEIMLIYSAAVQPDGDGNCTTPPVFPFNGATNLTLDYCLALENSAGVTNDKSALLSLAGTNSGLVDSGVPYYFADSLDNIFEGENGTAAMPYNDNVFWTAEYNPAPLPPDYALLEANLKFDQRPANGNDVILVLE